jgi:CheY-like chemotaxis protein
MIANEIIETLWRNALTWLIAEDEADIRNLIATMIQVWGHNPVAYENGQRVWDWLDTIEQGTAQDPLPELILMDIRMPGKKGNELANRMRTLPGFKSTPIVLMTAFSLSETERLEMIEQDGVDKIIHKPLPDFEELRTMLHNIVTSKQTAAATAKDNGAQAVPTPTVAAPTQSVDTPTPTITAPSQNTVTPGQNAVTPGTSSNNAADTITR